MNDIPDGFKMTELGPLPEEWRAMRLGDGLKLIKNGTTKMQNQDGLGYPISRIETVSNEKIDPNRVRWVDELTNKDLERYRLDIGDILISHINSEAHLGKSGVYEGIPPNLIHGMNLLRIKTDRTILDQYYLYYLFSFYRKKGFFIGISSRAVNQSSINQGKMKSLAIPLPPLSEQQAIAGVLSTVQEAREKTEGSIEATRALKKSLMKHLFTYGPVPLQDADKVPLKETEIGLVPEDWCVARLGDYIKKTQYGISLRGNQVGQYPILRMNCLIDGYVDTSDLQYVDLDGKEFHKFKLNNGDILFNRTNSYDLVGKTALFDLEDDFVFASYLVRIVPETSKMIPDFLNYYLNWDITQNRLKMLASRGVSQSNINATKLRSFRVPIPPLFEQQQIAHILASVDRKIEAQENKKTALNALFQTLLHNLMTAKIRVNQMGALV